MPERTAPHRTPPAPLGRPFFVVWAGQTISTIGSTLAGIGAAVWVYVTTGSVIWLGALAALTAIPVVLATPLATIVDRFDRRSVMIWADVAAAVGPTVALVLAMSGALEPWHVVGAGFIGAFGTAIQTPAYQAALPHLVTPAALGRANGLVQLAPAVGIVIGPALATPLVAWWGIEAVLVVDLASFAIGVTATLLTPFVAAVDHDGVAGGWSAGFTWLRGPGRALLALVAVVAVVNLALSYFNVAVVAAATDLGGTARAGLVLGAGGAAMVVGSLAMGAFGVPRRRIWALVVTLLAMSVGCLVAAGPAFAWLLVGGVLVLLTAPLANAVMSTIFHEHVPAGLQGRVFGIRAAVGRLLDPIGSLTVGIVMARVAAPAVSVGGVLEGSLGRAVGTGPERAAGVVLVGVAVALATTALVLRSLRVVRPLETAVETALEPVSDQALAVVDPGLPRREVSPVA